MPAPEIIAVGSAALIAAAPAALLPVIAMYTVNAAVNVSYQAANYKVNQESAGSLRRLADNLEDLGEGLAKITREKEMGITEPHLHINAILPENAQDYQESWTLIT